MNTSFYSLSYVTYLADRHILDSVVRAIIRSLTGASVLFTTFYSLSHLTTDGEP